MQLLIGQARSGPPFFLLPPPAPDNGVWPTDHTVLGVEKGDSAQENEVAATRPCQLRSEIRGHELWWKVNPLKPIGE